MTNNKIWSSWMTGKETKVNSVKELWFLRAISTGGVKKQMKKNRIVKDLFQILLDRTSKSRGPGPLSDCIMWLLINQIPLLGLCSYPHSWWVGKKKKNLSVVSLNFNFSIPITCIYFFSLLPSLHTNPFKLTDMYHSPKFTQDILDMLHFNTIDILAENLISDFIEEKEVIRQKFYYPSCMEADQHMMIWRILLSSNKNWIGHSFWDIAGCIKGKGRCLDPFSFFLF